MHHHCQDPNCQDHHNDNQPPTNKPRLLWTALFLIGGFALGELLVSLSSHSLALLAEAGHMVSDCLALGVALLATWVAALPASKQAPFGYRRVEILAALLNGVGLVAIALWIFWEAATRLQSPSEEILGIPMLVTAAIGVGVNSLNAFLLHDYSHHDLNLRGAFLHMVADAISSVGVLLAAIAVWTLHWNWADGVVSLFVALVILVGTIPLIRQSLNILLEKTPSHLDLDQIQSYLNAMDGVEQVNMVRVWAIAPGQETLIANLTIGIAEGEERDRLLHHLQASIHHEFGIPDVILQMTGAARPELLSLSQPQSLITLEQ